MDPVWPDEEVISLRDLLRILYRGRWLLVGIFCLVLGATATYTYTQEPTYESSLLIYMDPEKGPAASLDLPASFNRQGAQDRLAIEEEILRSRVVARRAADSLAQMHVVSRTGKPISVLRTVGENPPLQPTMDLVTDRLLGRIQVQTEGEYYDRMIRLTAESSSSAEAALLANVYSQAYLAHNRQEARSELRVSRRFLEEQKAKYETELERAEQALRQYRQEHGVVALDERSKRLVQRQADLESMKDQAQVELEMTQASLETLREKANEIEPGLAKRIASGLDRELQLLQEKKARLETDRQIIYSKNPQLRNADSIPSGSEIARINQQLEELQTQIDERAQAYVSEVMQTGGVNPNARSANDVSENLSYLSDLRRQITREMIDQNGLEARLGIIEQRLQGYEDEFGQMPEQMYRLAELKRRQQANEELYMYLVEKLQDTRLQEQAQLGYAHRIDEAQEPVAPVAPKPKLNLLLGAVLGLFLGAGAVFLKESMDTRIYRPEELENEGYPVSGVVLDFEQTESDGYVDVTGERSTNEASRLLQPTSMHGEAFRRIRLNLEFGREEGLQTILVTSPEPADGKTMTAVNLAASAARAGKRTALIDADMRHPGIHRVFGRERSPGLSDLLELHDGRMNGLRPEGTKLPNLDVFGAGTETDRPGELLESGAFRRFVADLRRQYEVVIFDSAPLLAVSDALPLARACDSSLMVVSSEKTHRKALDEAATLLERAGKGKMATVLNRFRPDAVFGYYYGYYKYYPEAHDSVFKTRRGRSLLLKLGSIAGLLPEEERDGRDWRTEEKLNPDGNGRLADAAQDSEPAESEESAGTRDDQTGEDNSDRRYRIQSVYDGPDEDSAADDE